jgi:hypothetical protein
VDGPRAVTRSVDRRRHPRPRCARLAAVRRRHAERERDVRSSSATTPLARIRYQTAGVVVTSPGLRDRRRERLSGSRRLPDLESVVVGFVRLDHVRVRRRVVRRRDRGEPAERGRRCQRPGEQPPGGGADALLVPGALVGGHARSRAAASESSLWSGPFTGAAQVVPRRWRRAAHGHLRGNRHAQPGDGHRRRRARRRVRACGCVGGWPVTANSQEVEAR